MVIDKKAWINAKSYIIDLLQTNIRKFAHHLHIKYVHITSSITNPAKWSNILKHCVFGHFVGLVLPGSDLLQLKKQLLFLSLIHYP